MTPIRIELPFDDAAGSVNAYLFTEPEPVLIDTGVKSKASWATLQTRLAEYGLSVGDLARVVITPPHVDHFGQAGMIAAHSDAEVWIADLGLPWLLDFTTLWQERLHYYRDVLMRPLGLSEETIDVITGYMTQLEQACDPVPAGRVVTFPVDGTLSLGGMSWQVVHTPGHASMQTCFYQPETRQFLSADMLLAKAPTPMVERPADGATREPSLPQFLQSLNLVESLDIEAVYPGHGEPFADHRQVIQRQRQRIQARTAECLQLITEGYHTVADLVNQMYAAYPLRFRFVGLWMLVGYLDLLKADSLVEERPVNGVWYYYAVNGEQ
ncbi:MAG TPA: MBL fold metallo-hydrolase [Anaerolineae bacterium]